jgi:hypothetical protein
MAFEVDDTLRRTCPPHTIVGGLEVIQEEASMQLSAYRGDRSLIWKLLQEQIDQLNKRFVHDLKRTLESWSTQHREDRNEVCLNIESLCTPIRAQETVDPERVKVITSWLDKLPKDVVRRVELKANRGWMSNFLERCVRWPDQFHGGDFGVLAELCRGWTFGKPCSRRLTSL